jgi:PIN domain nuclease of toxin-antitoxin system
LGDRHQIRTRQRASAPPSSGEVALDAFLAAGSEMLNVTLRHAAGLDGLPPLHGDPFEGMLIAQALSEPLRLLTADRGMAAYGAMAILET